MFTVSRLAAQYMVDAHWPCKVMLVAMMVWADLDVDIELFILLVDSHWPFAINVEINLSRYRNQ